MTPYEPFFRFLIAWLDKPLAAIGMSKTVFFSMLLAISAIFPNLVKPEWADWIQNILMPMVQEVKLGSGAVREVPTVSALQVISFVGLMLSIDDRLAGLKQAPPESTNKTTWW
jgi:hypothetical protein